jgi:hypothetical protein
LEVGYSSSAVVQNHKQLVYLVGDAVIQTHFWPGRGLNAGMKLAAACAASIANITLTPRNHNQKYRGSLENTEANSFVSDYNDFAQKLGKFEIKRSKTFLCQNLMTEHIKEAQATIAKDSASARVEAISKVTKSAKVWFEKRVRPGVWQLDNPGLDSFLSLVSERLSKLTDNTVALLARAEGWPNASGDGVLPQRIDDVISKISTSGSNDRIWKVAIIGGGPVGLLTAINLIEIMEGNVSVSIFESRQWLHDNLRLKAISESTKIFLSFVVLIFF